MSVRVHCSNDFRVISDIQIIKIIQVTYGIIKNSSNSLIKKEKEKRIVVIQ